ncbi:MAG: ribonuclease P protein component [Lachnospiraceae bacterium]|nr:ribonuclease P protein component [Lachnospiraceae bacterium]
MKNFNSLKKNEEFNRVYKKGKSYANKNLVMYLVKNDTSKCRIGISVSKKVGNSVVRHRMTRLLRECFRLNEDRFNTGLDMVVVVRASSKNLGFFEMQDSYLHLCGLHRILKEMV